MLIFFDIESTTKSNQIKQIGLATESDRRFLTNKENEFLNFINKNKGKTFVGHNIIRHDIKCFKDEKTKKLFNIDNTIDTLLLSTLLYSEKPYHKLVKNDKLRIDQLNNPVNDSINARILFFDLVDKFNSLDKELKSIYYLLLKDAEGFKAFFNYLKFTSSGSVINLIRNYFRGKICDNSNLSDFIDNNKIELAYTLSLINTTDKRSLFPAWVLKEFSQVEYLLNQLRSAPCDDCNYCHTNLDSITALKRHFGYSFFREFNGRQLQKEVVEGALRDESLIAVFPTGGGKSLAFQLPGIIDRNTTRGLTVVISPLQSLMKDQVDSLEDKNINISAAISGMLNPIERKVAIDRVKNGEANILYLAPESLRSVTIERILMSRKITRFVIDEAHCFSTWGHDFRVDYLYVADFIKKIQKNKGLNYKIPVSCFTATAKVDVIEDIKNYFKTNLDLDLVEYTTSSTRKNLSYSVTKVETEFERYDSLRNLLLTKDTPTIIYCSRIKTVEKLTKKLNRDNFKATMFHGQLDKDQKVEQQEQFMNGSINIMVATSAFGMGIDKDNVERVIHYEISDSLENYVQEAGRAGRDQRIRANCYIFYNDDDLNKHFELLNNSKLNHFEINQMWLGIRNLTKYKNEFSKSPLELATTAGWDENKYGVETRVKTAIATLEDAGYIKRKNNSPKIFADSLLSKSVIEAKDKMAKSNKFNENEMVLANRIIQSLISTKHKLREEGEVAETRVDYLSEILGVDKAEVINIINKFREIGILAKDKDLFAHIEFNSTSTIPNKKLETFKSITSFVLAQDSVDDYYLFNLKKLKADLEKLRLKVDIRTIKQALNYLELSNFIKIEKLSPDELRIEFRIKKDEAKKKLEKNIVLSKKIIDYVYHKSKFDEDVKTNNILPFSIVELNDNLNKHNALSKTDYKVDDVENGIYLLTRIAALKIEGGFLVIYNPLNIEKIETNPKKEYTETDYQRLKNYYKNKKEQIHIVGEYANKMVNNEYEAGILVEDYFTMEYDDFLDKYFIGEKRKELEQNMTPKKYKQLFGKLSEQQKDIILDDYNKQIGVFAGPGSGKTTLLVCKLISILYNEDTKTDELLMLTFSRQAALEFKSKLYELIGEVAYHVNITTFHSFAFDVMDLIGNEDQFNDIIKEATNAIINKLADHFKITISVLVIDEAQDMTETEFNLVRALINYNSGIRVIGVGDDDQNIFEWRGASSLYLKKISEEGKAYELTRNYRSKKNLVEFANLISSRIQGRYKKGKIFPNFSDDGTIEAHKYNSDNMLVPLVNKVINDQRKGKTCIITRTNKDAVLISGLLNNRGIKTSLIQNYDVDLRLYNILEYRHFYNFIKERSEYIVSMDTISGAFKDLKQKFVKSKNYLLTNRTLNNLLDTCNEKYLSILNQLLFETYHSDFYDDKNIVVSTFHKAKGKEFDNVYLLYEDERIKKDIDRRLFYVGVTRAKDFLSIHSKMDYSKIKLRSFNYYIDNNHYEEPKYIELFIQYTELNLGVSKGYQNAIEKMIPGDKIKLTNNHFLIGKDEIIGKLSQLASKNIKELEEKDFKVSQITLENLVYWYDNDETKKEYLLPFCNIVLKRSKRKINKMDKKEQVS